MNVNRPLALLGGLSPARFMERHWQRKPLLVRQAIPGFTAPLSRRELFELAGREGVESRVVAHDARGGWSMKRGPFCPRSLPPVKRAGWTLLVQGVDLHDDGIHGLLNQFRFVPDTRLDDLMISYATDTGGVGPHFDSYDVFLLQAHGRRRWRIGRQRDLTLQEGVPLKVLQHFEPEHEWVLEPGDMLYLPPRYAHDGVAEGECMTYSIGFRAPSRDELAADLLSRLVDEPADEPVLYRDAGQPAVSTPGRIPAALADFARQAMLRALDAPGAVERALGEHLTEPKGDVWFEPGDAPSRPGAIELDRRTRMMYDGRHLFINGESYRAGGADARLMRQLADARRLDAQAVQAASDDAQALLRDWCEAGWARSST
ncbi:MAG: cupin domain-containing protein [Burkholderiaceae bacterium]|nr:cupin domain-containing protein [Burkholderiaceae bacterium]